MSAMLKAEIGAAAAPVAPPEPRSLRFIDRASALGLAVDYLMSKPAFAGTPFGHWSRVLAGQINRGHYVFICRGRKVVGFAGWALATAEEAESWLAGESNPAAENGRTGSCAVLNAWAANDPVVQDFLVKEIRRIGREMAGVETIYAKREYANGRTRLLRLRVKDAGRSHPTERHTSH